MGLCCSWGGRQGMRRGSADVIYAARAGAMCVLEPRRSKHGSLAETVYGDLRGLSRGSDCVRFCRLRFVL
jgi:hypothetical protein